MIPSPFQLAPGTLARRLAAQVTLLVGLLALSLALLSMVAIRQTMTEEMDQELTSSAQRSFDWERRVGEDPKVNQVQFGRRVGSITVMVMVENYKRPANTPIWRATMVASNGEIVDVSEKVVETFRRLPASQNPRLVLLPDNLGLYRALIIDRPPRPSDPNARARDPRDVALIVEALPMTPVRAQTLRVLFVEALLAAVTLTVGLIVVVHMTRKLLRPLSHLSAAANQISELPLAHGSVEIPSKVEVRGEPTEELNQVATAFNRMLSHVGSALKQREQSEAKVRQFVADASHELRNPLAAIRGYAEITRPRRHELPPDTVFVLERIDSESERMSHLVEDLLLLARMDTNPSLSLAETDLNETVVEAASDARVAGSDHKWNVILPNTPTMALVDKFRVHQVIANLLANARTHTPAGTSVITRLAAEGSWAVISVQDNGPGIPADLLPAVFNRFSRNDPSRVRQQHTSSTGLGLAIVKSVVEAHGGEVSVDSEEGKGTRFVVRLPLVGPGVEAKPLSPA